MDDADFEEDDDFVFRSSSLFLFFVSSKNSSVQATSVEDIRRIDRPLFVVVWWWPLSTSTSLFDLKSMEHE